MQIKSPVSKFLFALTFLTLTCCSSPESFNDNSGKDRTARMTKAERESLAPNELFLAVVDGRLDEVQKIAISQPLLVKTRNAQNGDSPLGLAVQLREEKIARFLLSQVVMDQSELFKGNSSGESLVFQAARAGWPWMIKELADSYYRTLGLIEDYEFHDLDFSNTLGQRALHVAQSPQVIEALSNEYWRGTLEFPFRDFVFATDNLGRNFIHTAALDGRNEILRWAADKLCSRNVPEELVGEFIGSKVNFIIKAYQTFAFDLGIGFGIKFNDIDQFGKSPLHYASARRKTETLRTLARCEWLDYDLKDEDGNNPLQSMILALDDQRSQISTEDLDSLRFLTEQVTKMTALWPSKSHRINSANLDGESSLHLAARLADPRPYEWLKELGNTELLNNNEQSAREIFETRKKRIEAYGQ